MYSHIERKIKVLAITIAIITLAIGFMFASTLVLIGLLENEVLPILIGFALFFAIPVLAWVGSFVLYGFGELIALARKIADNTASNATPPSSAPVETAPPVDERRATIERLHREGILTDAEFAAKLATL
ncbi:MAG: hypothetical protein IKV35_03935 [Clostridia bacterium]|nr:hypothetical protein [Clostridia bacterium]